MNLIELKNLHKSFDDQEVLAGVHLELAEGESLAIMGKSGIGKSVTLLITTGLMQPDRGEVLIRGRNIVGLHEDELIPIRRRFSYVFQSGALFDSLTVLGNVTFPLVEEGASKEEAEEKVQPILDSLDLRGVADLMPAEISTGMKKRVAIARAIATSPDAILYDEPTTGVDPLTGKMISRLIRKLNRELGIAAIVVTHDLKCASIVADRVAFLDDGCFQFQGPFEEFVRQREGAVRRFLDALPHMAAYIGLPENSR